MKSESKPDEHVIFIKIRQNLIIIITTGKYKLNEQLAIHGKCVVITKQDTSIQLKTQAWMCATCQYTRAYAHKN